MVKADGSVLIHSDGGSYKPLNWMSPPCQLQVVEPEPEQLAAGVIQQWVVQQAKTDDRLVIRVFELISDQQFDLGVDPGLVKDGVEAHLQELLAAQVQVFGARWSLVRREFPTAIGPVDLLLRDSAAGEHTAVEVKRRANIDGVEQLTRYLELLNRDPMLAPVTGVLAAQTIAPQARTLAEDRGIKCLLVDYDELRGLPRDEMSLF
jgi:RecB family endonuclease NucS